MSTSKDGGLTWSAAVNTAGMAQGVGGQPLVQKSGTVVVPIDNPDGTADTGVHLERRRSHVECAGHGFAHHRPPGRRRSADHAFAVGRR